MSETNYPVSENFKVLEGYDIYRSSNLILAVVAVESKFGKDLRLYRWQKRTTKEGISAWKVDLARMSVTRWKWEELANKVRELERKYEIKAGPKQD